MKFTSIVALVGVATAIQYKQANDCGCAAPIEEPFCGCSGGAHLEAKTLRGSLDASARLASSQAGCDGYARLSNQSAGSNTEIGASQYTIPDKNIVTDQARVSESVSRGGNKEQTCKMSQKKFQIGGEITVTEKYNDSLKGEQVSEKCGQGAAQTRSRTQVLDSCNGSADIPLTAQCGGASDCGCNSRLN
jgi:hypothetical protein